MNHPNFVIFYVDNPLRSADFYKDLLEIEPTEYYPTFSSFNLASGITLGLWSKHTAEPAPSQEGCSGELCFSLSSSEKVDELFKKFVSLKMRIIQKPVMMDFGYTFAALDPDNHRLRVFYVND